MMSAAVVVIVEVGVELGDHFEPAGGIDGLVQRAFHAEYGLLENQRGVANGVRHLFVPRRHAVERPVRLDMVQRHALGGEEAGQRADLIDEAIGQLVPAQLHLASTEALQVRQGRMRADAHPMGLRQADSRAHVVEVGGVKAARDVGDIDQRHQTGVVAHFVKAERLSHVAVDGRHPRSPLSDQGDLRRLGHIVKS